MVPPGDSSIRGAAAEREADDNSVDWSSGTAGTGLFVQTTGPAATTRRYH